MPRYIVKLADNKYVEWSTVIDAPVIYIMDKDEILEYIKETRDEDPQVVFDRIERNGHSTHYMEPQTPEELVYLNRAGDGEKEITLEEILINYAK